MGKATAATRSGRGICMAELTFSSVHAAPTLVGAASDAMS